MKESIYTIPINEAFGLYDGCPLCRLACDLERASLDYILGPAMMEPDVRACTNRLGFCRAHLSKMQESKSMLPLALMLESHLPGLDASLFSRAAGATADERVLKKLRSDACGSAAGCFVCERIDGFIGHYYSNIVYLWKTEPDFKGKFARQPFFCVPHYAGLLQSSQKGLPRREQAAFIREISALCRKYLELLEDDLSQYCRSYDYRFAGQPLTEGARTGVARAAEFLRGASGTGAG